MNTQSSPPLMSNEDNNELDLDMQPAKGKAAKNRRKRNASKKKASANINKQQLDDVESNVHGDKPPFVEETPPTTTGADAKTNATEEGEVEPATSSAPTTATTPPASKPASSTAPTTDEAPTEAKANSEGDQEDSAGVEGSRRYKSQILFTFMREVDRLNSMMRNLLVRARLKYYKMASKHHDTSATKSEKQATGADESMLENEELFNETATEKLIEPDKNKGADESKITKCY